MISGRVAAPPLTAAPTDAGAGGTGFAAIGGGAGTVLCIAGGETGIVFCIIGGVGIVCCTTGGGVCVAPHLSQKRAASINLCPQFVHHIVWSSPIHKNSNISVLQIPYKSIIPSNRGSCSCQSHHDYSRGALGNLRSLADLLESTCALVSHHR